MSDDESCTSRINRSTTSVPITTDCVHSGCVNMLTNRTDIYLVRAGYI